MACCILESIRDVQKPYIMVILFPASFSGAAFCTDRTYLMSVCAVKLSKTPYRVGGEHQLVLHCIIYGSAEGLTGRILCDGVRAVLDDGSGVSV